MAGSQKSLGDMIVRIVGDNAEFDGAVDKSQKKLDSFSSSASKIGGNLTKFITLPLVGIGAAAVKTAADMEKTQLSFEVLLGSGEKAKVLLGQLKKFADTTPFEFKDVAQGAKTLLSFGIAAEKILPLTKQLGDIALGDSEKFKSLSLVFGQISSTGRLMGQDLLQLINVGFNPLQEISRKTGESMAELKIRMEKGAISAEEVAGAFQSATEAGGRFFGGTDKLAKSFDGQVSTLVDSATTLARSFGELILPTLKDMVAGVTNVINELNKLDPNVKKTIGTIALFAAAAGPAIFAFSKISGTITLVKTSIESVGVAVKALATLNPAFLWAAGFTIAVGLVAAGLDALEHANERTEQAIAKRFNVTMFDQTKTLKENEAAFFAARKTLFDYMNTVANTERQMAKGIELNQESTNRYYQQKEAISQLKPLVEDFKKKLQEQAKAAKEQEAALKGGAQGLEDNKVKTESLSKAIAFQNQLVALNLISEKDAFAEKIKLRDAEISKIIAGLANEKLSNNEKAIAVARVKELQALNADNQASLDLIKQKEDAITKAQAEKAEATKRAREEVKALTQDSVSGTEERIAALLNEKAELLSFAGTMQERAAIESAYSSKINAVRDADQKKQDERRAKDLQAVQSGLQTAVGVFQNFFGALNQLYQADSAAKIQQLTAQHDAAVALLDTQLQAELAAAGVADKTALESAQEKLSAAVAANDQEAISEAEKAVKKAEIEQAYADKLAAINKAFQKEKADQEYKAAMAQWELNLANAIAGTAVAVVNALQTTPFILGLVLAVAAGVAGAVQIAAVSNAKPKPPQLAAGGVALPKPGGIMANIAEAGQPEVVLPLDRVGEFIDTRGFSGGKSGGGGDTMPVNLVIRLSEKVLYDGIFQATRNKTVLIDAGAVV